MKIKQTFKENQFAYFCMLPALILVIFATIYPLIFSIDYSFYQSKIFTKIKFIFLENYINLFKEPRFFQNLINTFIFTFAGIIVCFLFGFFLAYLLREQNRSNAVYRTILLLPWITNEVVLALMWKWILNPQTSPITFLLEKFGLPSFNLLQSTILALPVVTFINAWRAVGYSLIMVLAALTAIPKEAEEAAEVEGASRFMMIRKVILPLIKPAVLVTIIVLTISFFNIIVLVMDMTGGGPLNSTELISLRLYKEGFSYFNINIASTLTVIMLFTNLILASGYMKILKTESHY